MNDHPPFIGDWYMERRLGEGGFGIVSLWKNKKTSEEVAIKKYNLPNERNDTSLKDRERCFKEVNYMTNELQHDNIVKGLKMDSDFLNALTKNNSQGLPVLVMEYCEKGDLRRELNNLANTNGLPEMEVRNVLRSLRNAIAYLHQHGITHRDIKPENIVIKSNNGHNIYKLTDLGYARNISSTVAASLVGTIEYVAPELFQSMEYSRTVDYWSMGIIGFEIICGFRPFVPHQSIAQRFVHLKKKTSIHIAITENNNDRFSYHTSLFNENRLTKCFKEFLEKWLTLPLEKDPKQRGSVFEKPINTAPDGVSADPVAPVKVLKIYTQLDEILNKNILTIFSLYNYAFLSCVVTPETTLNELLDFISNGFKIPKNELYIIPTLEQTIVNRIDNQTKPFDLFIKDFYEYPMIYVTRNGCYIEGVIKPCFPEIVKEALQDSKQYKLFVQIELIRNIIYFLRNEQRLYSTFLYGLKNYSMYVNDEIDKFRDKVNRMCSSSMRLLGKIDFYQETVELSKQKLEEKNKTHQYEQQIGNWDKECTAFKEKSFKIFDACNIIEKRYKSILRRSSESLKNGLTENYNNNIFNNIKAFEHLYRDVKGQKAPYEQKIIIKSLIESIKERDRILKSREFLDVQICLKEIHIEYKAIGAAMTNALSAIDKLNSELFNANKSHHEQFWTIYEEISRPLSTIPSESLTKSSDINSIIEHFSTMNEARLSPRSLKDITSMEISCYGEGNDTKLLIDENHQIIAAFADLVKDVTNEQGSPDLNT